MAFLFSLIKLIKLTVRVVRAVVVGIGAVYAIKKYAL